MIYFNVVYIAIFVRKKVISLNKRYDFSFGITYENKSTASCGT